MVLLTGSHYVSLTDLEPATQSRLASNSLGSTSLCPQVLGLTLCHVLLDRRDLEERGKRREREGRESTYRE